MGPDRPLLAAGLTALLTGRVCPERGGSKGASEAGALGRGRALTRLCLRAARTRTSGAGNVASAWRPRPRSKPDPGCAEGEAPKPRDEGAVDSSWAAQGGRTGSVAPARPARWLAARHFQSRPETRGGVHPQLLRRGLSRPRAASRPPPPFPGRACCALSRGLRPSIVFALYY